MPNQESFLTSFQAKGGGEKISIRITVEGRVQKVGLRNWLKNKAVSFKVCGWVRNRNDGNVEAMLYGHEEDVKELIKLCHQGPSFAHVKRIKEFPQPELDTIPTDFSILATT